MSKIVKIGFQKKAVGYSLCGTGHHMLNNALFNTKGDSMNAVASK